MRWLAGGGQPLELHPLVPLTNLEKLHLVHLEALVAASSAQLTWRSASAVRSCLPGSLMRMHVSKINLEGWVPQQKACKRLTYVGITLEEPCSSDRFGVLLQLSQLQGLELSMGNSTSTLLVDPLACLAAASHLTSLELCQKVQLQCTQPQQPRSCHAPGQSEWAGAAHGAPAGAAPGCADQCAAALGAIP
jgi:hypothetical protein